MEKVLHTINDGMYIYNIYVVVVCVHQVSNKPSPPHDELLGDETQVK